MNQQKPSGMPFQRYRPFPPIDLPDRTWPSRTITEAPRWLSTDLRDGNQALIDPMSPARKMKMFELLVKMGYKEIEVGFPSASETDFSFVRQLIESDRIPDDVTISVLTQAREDLIERTVQSLVGVPKANIHLYNALAPLFRRVVFHAGKDEIKDIAVRGTELVMKHSENYLDTTVIGYEYSPEIFTSTERGVPVSELPWEAPYLPIDPKDVGRTYEAVIRVNSQSGKGGVAYILKSEHKLDLPRRLQIEFSGAVQRHTDDEGGEMSPAAIWSAFEAEYLTRESPLQLNSVHTSSAAGEKDALTVNVYVDGELCSLQGTGNGPLDAFVNAINGLPSMAGRDVRVLDYAEHALSSGGDATAAAYVECAVGDQVLWGVGLDPNIVTASLKAVISAVNRG
jgi:hypothetical protein